MNQKYINIILAALIVVAIGVAIFKEGDTQTIVEKVNETFRGVTNYDTVEVENILYEVATTTGAQNLVTGGISMQIPAGVDNVYWTNNTGRDVDVYLADLIIPSGQVSSSTNWVSVLATSTTALGNQFDYDGSALTVAQGGDTFLFRAIRVATSTTASSTSSALNESTINGTSKPSVFLRAGRNLVMYIESAQAVTCLTSGQCGTATATDRGINPVVRFFWTSTTTTDVGR